MSTILAQLRELDWDRQHVQVRFETLPSGAMVYVKQFKPQAKNGTGILFADYWPERENSLLTRLQEANAEHAVRVEAVSRAENTIRTYDAGISLANLLQFPVTFVQEPTISTHPFFSTTEFLKLLKGIIVALNEIHRSNIIHADLNAGNICVKVVEDDTEQCCHIDYSQIQLIDFAFSLCGNLPLQHILPIDTEKATYMAPLYREALQHDIDAAQANNWVGKCENIEKEMHPYMDFYSLGILAQDLYDKGVRPSKGIKAGDLEGIISSLLKFFDSGKPRLTDKLLICLRGLPEKRILVKIDQLLDKSGNKEMVSQKFRISLSHNPAGGRQGDTPRIAGKTPIITPIKGAPPQDQEKQVAGESQFPSPKNPASDPVQEQQQQASSQKIPQDQHPLFRFTKKSFVFVGGVILALLGGGGIWLAYQSGQIPQIFGDAPTAQQIAASPAPEVKKPETPSVDSLRRILESGAPWPADFAELLRQHGQNSELASDLVQSYGKILDDETKTKDANSRQRQAWRILESLSGLDGVGQFALLARQALEQYRSSTEQLSQNLQGMLKDPKRQAKEQSWPGYEQRLNLQADMGDARSSLFLGVIMAAQGKTAPAFHRLLDAAGSKDMVVQKAGLESLPNFLEAVLQSQDKQVVRNILPELKELIRKGADPNWQIWLNRMKEALGEE